MVANRNGADILGARAHCDMVAQGWVALFPTVAGTAEGYALGQMTEVADYRRLADNHAHAVIDKQALADFGPGMNFNPGHKAAEVRDQPRQERHAHFM